MVPPWCLLGGASPGASLLVAPWCLHGASLVHPCCVGWGCNVGSHMLSGTAASIGDTHFVEPSGRKSIKNDLNPYRKPIETHRPFLLKFDRVGFVNTSAKRCRMHETTIVISNNRPRSELICNGDDDDDDEYGDDDDDNDTYLLFRGLCFCTTVQARQPCSNYASGACQLGECAQTVLQIFVP